MTQDTNEELDLRSRSFEHKGVTYILTASDPYGFYDISIRGKKTPDGLTGNFTSLAEAEKHIIRHTAAVK